VAQQASDAPGCETASRPLHCRWRQGSGLVSKSYHNATVLAFSCLIHDCTTLLMPLYQQSLSLPCAASHVETPSIALSIVDPGPTRSCSRQRDMMISQDRD